MSKATLVPITPSVLNWAMGESGYTKESLAHDLKIPSETLRGWLEEGRQPSLTEFRKLVSLLKRTPSTFLLPSPPDQSGFTIQFRRPTKAGRSLLLRKERHAIREARRIQEAISWITNQLDEQLSELPQYSISNDVETVAHSIRFQLTSNLNGSFGESWQDTKDAWEDWRAAVERAGILVFQFPLGKEGVGGFSLWDKKAPLIAVNTAWNSAARIFSLLHELGHLVTRTSSACLELRGHSIHGSQDHIERWCEQFAAAVLIPADSLRQFLQNYFKPLSIKQVTNLEDAKRVASYFKASLRSSVLRLIELNLASWSLYEEIPPISDEKKKGGGGSGRVRGQIKEDQYGERTVDLFVRALNEEILDRSKVLDYLDIPDSYLDKIQQRTE